MFIGNLLCFQLCSLSLVLPPLKRICPLTFSLQVFSKISNLTAEPSFHQAEGSQMFHLFLTSEMLQSPEHLSFSFLEFIWQIHVSLAVQSPELSTVLQMWSQQCKAEGLDHVCWPAGYIFSHTAQDASNICCKGTSLAHVQPGTPGNFLSRCFPGGCPSAYTGVCVGLLLFRCRTWYFSLLRFCQPIPPACQLSAWQHNSEVLLPLPVSCHLQTSWADMLSHHSVLWLRY